MKSASPIYAVDINETMSSLSNTMGADSFVYNVSDILHKVDVIIDTTGIPPVISAAYDKLAPSGRLILVGQPRPGAEVEIPNAVSMFDGTGKSIRATQGGGTDPEKDIPRYIALAERGLLEYQTLHTNTFTLDEVNAAFDLLRSGDAGRIMINIGEE
tara:strand:- start:140 stop:610 length:471 start_codon:yes stop_codon:yes gene_type:complete